MLAQDLPQARIITYGYDADVVHLTREAGLNTVRDHATNLILDLSNLRGGPHPATGRPIIFVVHSLGGLVCQDAIFNCNNATEKSHQDILSSVLGVVFFGTPHAGSDFAAIANAAASLVSLAGVKKPNSSVLHVLDRNSAMLANIENDFSKLVLRRLTEAQEPIKLFVFVEELPVKGLGRVSSVKIYPGLFQSS